jgi:hypothetical protein
VPYQQIELSPVARTDVTCDLSLSESPAPSLSPLPLRDIIPDDTDQNRLTLKETPSSPPLSISLFMTGSPLPVLQLPLSQTLPPETPVKNEGPTKFERPDHNLPPIPSLPMTPESPPNSSKSKQSDSKSTKSKSSNKSSKEVQSSSSKSNKKLLLSRYYPLLNPLFDCIRLLVNHGLDINQKSKENWWPSCSSSHKMMRSPRTLLMWPDC